MNHLSYRDAKVILTMAQCGMQVPAVAEELCCSQKIIEYRLKLIREITGLNPLGFFELYELVQIAHEILGDDDESTVKEGVDNA